MLAVVRVHEQASGEVEQFSDDWTVFKEASEHPTEFCDRLQQKRVQSRRLVIGLWRKQVLFHVFMAMNK